MGTKLHLQLEDIYSDPYGFTYSEVAETIGEEQADKLYHNLYSGPNGKKQSTIRTWQSLGISSMSTMDRKFKKY